MPPPLAARMVILPVALSIIFALGLSPLFAAVADPDANIHHNAEVYVVDLDGAQVGGALTAFFNGVEASGKPLPKFTVVSLASAEAARQAVRDGTAWAVLWAAPGATAALSAALSDPAGPGGAGYDATAAIGFAWDEGRNNMVASPRVGGAVRGLLGAFCTTFATSAVPVLVAQGGSNAVVAVATSPRADLLVRPVAFTEENLFPFDVPVAAQAQILGNILVVVFAFAVVNALMMALGGPLAAKYPNAATRAHVRLGLIVAYAGVITATLSTMITGLARTSSAADHVKTFTGTGAQWAQLWAVYWLLFVVICTFFAAVATYLGTPAPLPLFLVFVLLYNVVSLNIDTAAAGYQFYYYAPMVHATTIVRSILFGSQQGLIGRSLGVLFAWAVWDIALFYAASLYPRKRPGAPSAPGGAGAGAGGAAGVQKPLSSNPGPAALPDAGADAAAVEHNAAAPEAAAVVVVTSPVQASSDSA